MWGLEKLEGNQAAQLGLLSAGAAMLDPRGTGGNTGAAFNKGIRAGMNTYIPMMQWQQNKKDRKEDRNWNKEQDVIRNVLQERQFKQRKAALESETENRSERTDIARAQLGMQQKQFEQSQAAYKMKMDMYSQFMGGGEPAGPQTTNYGPRTDAVPQGKMGPRTQPQGQFQVPDMPPTDTSALTGPTEVGPSMFQTPGKGGGQKPMSGYDKQNMGQFLGMPGLASQGKDETDLAAFMQKEVFKHGIDMSKAGVRGDPIGVGYIVYDKQTGHALGKFGADMKFKPAPDAPKGKGEAISAENWMKQN
jgi:hypothetical protein